MSRPRQKIPVNGPQGGLPGAFAALNGLAFPAAVDQNIPASIDAGASPSEGPSGGRQVPAGRVVLARLKAQRAGKVVITISGFGSCHRDTDIEELARRIRVQCGCGGTVSARVIEVQGDQAPRIRAFLEAEGFRVAGV